MRQNLIPLFEHLKSEPELQDENKEGQQDCVVVDTFMMRLER
jgi:hypothetical protein